MLVNKLRRKQMDDIFLINKNKDGIAESTEVYYTLIGMHSYKDDDELPMTDDITKAFAKKRIILNKTTPRYFIKIGAYGKPLDPMGMYSENQFNKFSTKSGKNLFEFKEVNEKTFNYYTSFLKTKNKSKLIHDFDFLYFESYDSKLFFVDFKIYFQIF